MPWISGKSAENELRSMKYCVFILWVLLLPACFAGTPAAAPGFQAFGSQHAPISGNSSQDTSSFLLPFPLYSDTLPLSLDELFAKGIQNSPSLQADRIEEEIARYQSQETRKAQLPRIQIDARFGYLGQPLVFQQGLSHPTRPDAGPTRQDYSANIDHPLYQGGRLHLQSLQAKLNQAIRQLQTQGDQSALKLHLLDSYLDLFYVQKQCQLMEDNIRQSEIRLHDIMQLQEEGIVTANDVLRSQMQLTRDKLALSEARHEWELLNQRLDLLLGLPEDLLISPDTSLLEQSLPLLGYPDYMEMAVANDPDLNLARKQTEFSKIGYRIEKTGYFPRLSAYANSTLARPLSSSLEDLYNYNYGIGLSLSYELSSLYTNGDRVKASRENIRLNQTRENERLLQLKNDVRTAYLHHYEALQEVEALRLSVLQAKENFRIMQNRYMSQLAILTDLLDANHLCLDVELQLTDAKTRVVYTWFELQRLCGQL